MKQHECQVFCAFAAFAEVTRDKVAMQLWSSLEYTAPLGWTASAHSEAFPNVSLQILDDYYAVSSMFTLFV